MDRHERTPPWTGVLIAGAALLAGCGEGPAPAPPAAPVLLFPEITDQVLRPAEAAPWPAGTFDLPEIMGGGVALLDYDGDGDLDLIEVRYPPPGQPDAPAPNRLYRQETDGTFTDVTAESGLGDPGYGQGVAVGDVDNDGDLDVYFTNFGGDAFYRNHGDGTFTNATAEAGFAGEAWSSSAAFTDYDADGDLDLFVAHYVAHDPQVRCQGSNLSPEYCGPKMYAGTLASLYRNDGRGTFEDVTARAGITTPGNGLGVLCADLTGDDRVDIYVANDQQVNHLWVNQGDGSFVDEAVIRGVGYSGEGAAEASMGITIGDVNDDGRLDLFLTNLRNESNRLYLATDLGIFDDGSDAAQTAMVDRPFTGFGCGFADFDHDADLDLAVVNGRVARGSVLAGAELGPFWNAYAEPNLLFANVGGGRFSRLATPTGGFGSRIEVGRGLALGDIDGDGDIDLAVGNLGGPLRIFRNDAPAPGTHWLLVRAMTGRRDAIGALVSVITGDRTLKRLVLAAHSYDSSSDPRAHFGLGSTERVLAYEVRWPDGARERFAGGPVDRVVTLRQGGEAGAGGSPP